MSRANRIQVLSPAVVNKIAAGEVIERPASVIKELLENSLDALSTRIDVEIEEGGTELIRIVDNGEGILPEDIPLAVTSHATSKLQQADDLFCVQTMGFRGEALASIAEVSKFRIRSRAEEQSIGSELIVDCGTRSEVTPCGCPQGTQIEIRHLFCNTPVRRKFLKKASTEFGYISEQFTRVALACPNLQMSLTHNGKSVYRLPAHQPLLDRLTLFFGSAVTEKLIPIETEHHGIRIWGYVGHPSLNKATRKSQFLYLNGRYIQDRSLQHALTESYRGLLMVGRFPVAFVFLEMPSDQVDVNVHPTKSEVRFRDGQLLFRMLLSTLRTKFLQSDLHSELTIRQPQATPQDTQTKQRKVEQDLVSWAKMQLEQRLVSPETTHGNVLQKTEGPDASLPQIWSTQEESTPEVDSLGENTQPAEIEAANVSSSEKKTVRNAEVPPFKPFDDPWSGMLSRGTRGSQAPAPPSEMTPAASAPSNGPPLSSSAVSDHATPAPAPSKIQALQVDDCYIVLSTDQGLTVIDQHALHERVLYERFRKKVLEGHVEVQKLLVPLTLELEDKQMALLLEQQELLREMGFGVEEFGRGMLAVTSHPVFLGHNAVEEVMRDLSDKFDGADAVSRRDLLDSSLHMMACKAAIKAGQRLTPDEIVSLLAQRETAEDAHHCPHGRPTALVLSREELDRQFGRLGA